jgi:hypothetical protein
MTKLAHTGDRKLFSQYVGLDPEPDPDPSLFLDPDVVKQIISDPNESSSATLC